MTYPKLVKTTRLMLVLGPLVEIDENYFAVGYGDGYMVAWAKLNGSDILVWAEQVPGVPHENGSRPKYVRECSHKELDYLLALDWKASKPISFLEQIARAAED